MADDSECVMVGMELTFPGFPIGRVRRIELAVGGKARQVIDVPRQDTHLLQTSSIFTLERGMVGDTIAERPRIVASERASLENLEVMTGTGSSINASLINLRTARDKLSGRYGLLTLALSREDQAKNYGHPRPGQWIAA